MCRVHEFLIRRGVAVMKELSWTKPDGNRREKENRGFKSFTYLWLFVSIPHGLHFVFRRVDRKSAQKSLWGRPVTVSIVSSICSVWAQSSLLLCRAFRFFFVTTRNRCGLLDRRAVSIFLWNWAAAAASSMHGGASLSCFSSSAQLPSMDFRFVLLGPRNDNQQQHLYEFPISIFWLENWRWSSYASRTIFIYKGLYEQMVKFRKIATLGTRFPD